MSECKCNIILIFVLISIFSNQGFSQQNNYRDTLTDEISKNLYLKPSLHYSFGSNVMVVPYLGSVTSFTFSPFLSVPLSSRLSVNGGIIAGRYYSSFWDSNYEGARYGTYNGLSVYGSASYQINPQLTLYGAGIKSLTETSPYYSIPKSSYTIGSTYNFGSFSIGVAFQMSNYNYGSGPWPIDASRDFNSPFDQRPGMFY